MKKKINQDCAVPEESKENVSPVMIRAENVCFSYDDGNGGMIRGSCTVSIWKLSAENLSLCLDTTVAENQHLPNYVI